MSNEKAVTHREAIQAKAREIGRLRHEIDEIARSEIPDFHFLDHRVSTFWTCDRSPVGMCVFNLEESRGRLVMTHCRYCGGPVERK
jgi:hypothetical protein